MKNYDLMQRNSSSLYFINYRTIEFDGESSLNFSCEFARNVLIFVVDNKHRFSNLRRMKLGEKYLNGTV